VRLRGGRSEAAISLIPVNITWQPPGSFTGTLPCGDCAGIHYQIDLLPDSVYYPRAIRRQAGDSTVRDDIGCWTLEAGGARLHSAATRRRPSHRSAPA
jgi:NlpE-like protein